MTYGLTHSCPSLVDLVRELQGSDSQVRFAARLGMEQSELSRFLRGGRRGGRALIEGLLREFPEQRDAIVTALTEAPPEPSADTAVA